jgi:FlaA1/EpsC-like NDP-sugar epimerase
MKFLNLFFRFWFSSHVPRWIILIIDLAINIFSLALAYFLRFNFSNVPSEEIALLPLALICLIIIRTISYLYFDIFKGVIRYTSSSDIFRIFISLFLSSAIIVIAGVIKYNFGSTYILPLSIVIIEFLCSLFIMSSLRLAMKALYFEYKNPRKNRSNILIFGAGEAGIITKRTLDQDAALRYKVIGFLDDDKNKQNKKIDGVNVFDASAIEQLVLENDASTIIITPSTLSLKRKNEIVDMGLDYNLKVLNLPPSSQWINGNLSFNQLKSLNIEDLLERDTIALDNSSIENQIKNKTVLISGGAGSIGSEIVRQLLYFHPKKLVVLDQAESPLFELENELKEKNSKIPIEFVIGDVRNRERMINVFKTFKPEIVYHAAAYKHVPLMENNPSEAILTNILGTKNLAELAHDHQVENFVFVSTDKAVNPTNVMGASKRASEIFIQSLNTISNTKFITTRFGNVLGSNGSVIPTFRKQIEKGGPLTITHPDITRFFMTIPEACQLVLEAGAMGNGGEIFLFDMGKPVKIIDLAKKMIQLSGLEPYKDINIVITGLRPGEKLYEELLADKENTLPTHNKKIMVAKVKENTFDTVKPLIENIIASFHQQNNLESVTLLKKLIPEYKSNNSEYEKLDIK